MKKHASIILLSFFFVLCCWGQMSEGGRTKSPNVNIPQRKRNPVVDIMAQVMKKTAQNENLKKTKLTKKQDEKETLSNLPCGHSYVTQFPFDEDLNLPDGPRW